MPSLLIVTIDAVTDEAAYARYKRDVRDLVARHGGRYLAATTEIEVIEGGGAPQRVLVVRFPTRADVHAMFADPDYVAIAPLRRESSEGTLLVVDEAA